MKRGERSKMNMNTKCILKYRFLVLVCGGNYDWGSVYYYNSGVKGLIGWEGERIGAFFPLAYELFDWLGR